MLSALSKWILDRMGWTIVGRYPPEVRKMIVVVMPHTSAWDFPLGLLLRMYFRADIKFFAKRELFRPPVGFLLRRLGGYPVDRSRRRGLVEAAVTLFREQEDFVATITPEGTRRKVDKLKTGFYYIALGAGIPILMVRFDYGRREVVFAELFFPSGDKDRDFRKIIDFFKVARGRHPERGIDERVRYR